MWTTREIWAVPWNKRSIIAHVHLGPLSFDDLDDISSDTKILYCDTIMVHLSNGQEHYRLGLSPCGKLLFWS